MLLLAKERGSFVSTLYRKSYIYFILLVLGLLPQIVVPTTVYAETKAPNEHEVMSSFNADEVARAEKGGVEDEMKHKILFWMGFALIFLVLATAVVGVNMAFFGKELFVAHMLLAGGTVFLSLAHAVTAIVWFYPF